jgi:hypothetical protein
MRGLAQRHNEDFLYATIGNSPFGGENFDLNFLSNF